jgi:hypothetical protein
MKILDPPLHTCTNLTKIYSQLTATTSLKEVDGFMFIALRWDFLERK